VQIPLTQTLVIPPVVTSSRVGHARNRCRAQLSAYGPDPGSRPCLLRQIQIKRYRYVSHSTNPATGSATLQTEPLRLSQENRAADSSRCGDVGGARTAECR